MTHDSLIVANTGQPFSRLGVISICASYRGIKRKDPPNDLFKESIDSDLPKAIRQKEIETYLNDTNRLLDDYTQEQEVSFDYGGRFLWELLQNADDAMCMADTKVSDLIGIKGLGFKSVLEITNKPTIYSDGFHFYFSAKETQKLLREKGIHNPPPLTFRVPHDIPNNEDIKYLVNEYPTIICLPFKDKIAQEKVESQLKNLSIFFLLLSQYLRSVEVIWPDGRNRLWRIDKNGDGEFEDGDISVAVIEDGVVKDTYRFRRWAHVWRTEKKDKRYSVACCLPLSPTGELQVWKDTFPLFSFFPTEELLPFRALIHASFDLDQSRKHVRDPDNDDILGKLEMLLGRIIDEVPAKISLKAFFPKEKPKEKTIAHAIWNHFESVLREKKFISCIGGEKEVPSKTKLWKYGLGNILRHDVDKVKETLLVEVALLEDSDVRTALEHLGAEPLEKYTYLTLLNCCKNTDEADCKSTLKTFFIIIKELIRNFPYKEENHYLEISRKIPCWFTSNGVARSLSDEKPFLREAPKVNLPSWLQFDTLDKGFLKYLNELESQDNNGGAPKIWEEIIDFRLLNNKRSQLLHYLLIPTIESKNDKDWLEQHGSEVLYLYQLWTNGLQFEEKPIAIWGDKKRERIGNAFFLPTDKGWLPARKCYAGKSWGASDSFDIFFSGIKDRGILKEPSQWPISIEKNKNHWKKILRYAGVSWEMKLTHKAVLEPKGWEVRKQSNSWWTECPFPTSLVQEEDWEEYISSLEPPPFNKKTQFDWDAKIHEQWGIEFFPKALPKKALDRLRVIQSIAKEAKDSEMRYTYQKIGSYYERNRDRLKSFASWQIQDFPWLPCKQSLLDSRNIIPPKKAYMSGKGIGGLLPEIDIKIPEDQEGRDLANFLTQTLGVRENLPSPGDTIWKEWINELPRAAERTTEKNIAITATRTLLRTFFDIHDEEPEWFDSVSNVPCLKLNQEKKDECLTFDPPNDIYWLDESYLAEPNTRIELLRRFNILILEQEHGKKAAEWYDIKPLSTIVKVEPKYYSEDDSITETIKRRYKERYNSLKIASGLSNLIEPEDLKVRAVDNLRLKIRENNQTISAPPVSNWEEKGYILLDRDRKWEGLGLALTQKKRGKGLSSLFEILLQAKDSDEVLQRLRDLGVPEAAIKDIESDFNVAVDNGAKEPNNQTKNKEETAHEDGKDTQDKSDFTGESSKSDKIPPKGNHGGIKEPLPDHSSSQRRREKGEDAEKWLRSKISDLLSTSDWKVSGRPERDSSNRESDIVLSHYNFGKYHIEVKYVEQGKIFWSEREVSKAKDNKDKYWMTIVRQNYTEDDKNIIWLWNPLEELQNLPISGKWFWKTESNEERIEISAWEVPLPRKKEDATNFSFIITVDDQFLGSKDFKPSKGLDILVKRVNSIT